MEREEIQRVFNRDFRNLLGVDIFEIADDLEYLYTKKGWKECMTEAVVTPCSLLTINLLHIIDDFLLYDDKRFPQPLDQYIYIYENKELIFNMLRCNLKIDSPFDDPVAYKIYIELEARFDNLFNNLLTCGNTHKFDPELVRRTLDMDPDEPA